MDMVPAIHTEVRRISLILIFDPEYSETYLVTPELIPPVDMVKKIEEKLPNWPKSAIPAGPISAETNFTLINPVIILTTVEIAVRVNTFTISLLITLRNVAIINING